MAKPDDTRIAPASKNAAPGSSSNRIPGTSSSHIAETLPSLTPTPAPNPTTQHAALIPVLEALLAKLKAATAAPVPPKSARPPRIKPRRRVTVGTSLPPASDAHIPRIRLCGHWLVRAGFGLHTGVRVHVAQDCLILIPEQAG
jgi:hypothetical protein